MAKSHPAGMQICYAIFAGISLRLCSISLRSFRITFAAYLPTHFKSLRDFFQSLLNYHRDNLYIISPNTHPHTIREIYHPQKKSVSEICVSQRKHKAPTQSVRFPPHKKNQWDLWDLCEPQENTKPHTIREISHPQKKSVRSVRSVWAKEKKYYFSSRSATA